MNCYPSTYTPPTTYYWYTAYADQIKVEAMRLALDARSGRPFKEVAKLASQIEEYLRG